eukprot:6198839-Pleurochrysis_carterae.AAC.1
MGDRRGCDGPGNDNLNNEGAAKGKGGGPPQSDRKIRNSIRYHGTGGDPKGTGTRGLIKPGKGEVDTSRDTSSLAKTGKGHRVQHAGITRRPVPNIRR